MGLRSNSGGDPGRQGQHRHCHQERHEEQTRSKSAYEVQVQGEDEDRMGNGIFNPDGSEKFDMGPLFDSLQAQINLINEQLQDVIEVEEG